MDKTVRFSKSLLKQVPSLTGLDQTLQTDNEGKSTYEDSIFKSPFKLPKRGPIGINTVDFITGGPDTYGEDRDYNSPSGEPLSKQIIKNTDKSIKCSSELKASM